MARDRVSAAPRLGRASLVPFLKSDLNRRGLIAAAPISPNEGRTGMQFMFAPPTQKKRSAEVCAFLFTIWKSGARTLSERFA